MCGRISCRLTDVIVYCWLLRSGCRVASRFRVVGGKSVASCEIWAVACKFQVASRELRVAGNELQAVGCKM